MTIIQIEQKLDTYDNQLTVFTLREGGSIYIYTVTNYNRSFSDIYGRAIEYFKKIRNSSKVLE